MKDGNSEVKRWQQS